MKKTLLKRQFLTIQKINNKDVSRETSFFISQEIIFMFHVKHKDKKIKNTNVSRETLTFE
jgi:hypothetical protein